MKVLNLFHVDSPPLLTVVIHIEPTYSPGRFASVSIYPSILSLIFCGTVECGRLLLVSQFFVETERELEVCEIKKRE